MDLLSGLACQAVASCGITLASLLSLEVRYSQAAREYIVSARGRSLPGSPILVNCKIVSILNVPPYLAAGFVPGTDVAGAVVAGLDVALVVCGGALVVVAAGALDVVASEVVAGVEQALINSIEINEIASSVKSHFFIRYTSV